MTAHRRTRLLLAGAVLLLLAFALGALWGGRRGDSHPAPPAATEAAPAPTAAAAAAEVWTCSMHPQVRQPKPGKCPICAMDLIPASGGDGPADGDPSVARLSAVARALAGVEVVPAERRPVAVTVRLVGKVRYDETRLATITARVPGRVDRLYADVTGTPIQAGEHLAELYSPELIAAQEELLQALRTASSPDMAAAPSLADAVRATLEASREKLRLWGLTSEQIDGIERHGRPLEHLTLNAPLSGVVIDKAVVEGAYVETGTRLYTIADLSRLWVVMDAYESDLGFLRYGQEVVFSAEAWPGHVFRGRIAFISPTLDAATRTVPVRVNVENPDGRLKPEMFVRAAVHASLDAAGEVARPDLAGKWLCSMHPEVVATAAGSCERCGMPLRRAEDLGHTTATPADELPLVIPASAPLLTGRRALVYVAKPGEEGVFSSREVRLGPRAGPYYVVREGLEPGERVVVAGNFKIDSSLQLEGKPGMMALPADDGAVGAGGADGDLSAALAAAPVEVPSAFQVQLQAVVEALFTVGSALAADSLPEAVAGAAAMARALSAVDSAALSGPALAEWRRREAGLNQAVALLGAATAMEEARRHFEDASRVTGVLVSTFGLPPGKVIYRLRCPMAFDNRGAEWLQPDREVRNPYFGAAMLSCGDVAGSLGQASDGHGGAGGHRHGQDH